MADASQGNDQLEREMEQTRERLASTIDQLVDRTSPKRIIQRDVAAVKAYFVAPDGGPRTENILTVAGGVLGLVAVVVGLRLLKRG